MLIWRKTVKIGSGLMSATITHNLNDVNAKLAGFTPMLWLTQVAIVSRTNNTMTLNFNSPTSQTVIADIKVVSP